MCTANNFFNKRRLVEGNGSLHTILPAGFRPGPTDILCGRGNVFSKHAGNRYFSNLVRDHTNDYREAQSRTEKIRVVEAVLCELVRSGHRFAKINAKTQRWHELDMLQAHEKVGHAIRDIIRLTGKKQPTRSQTAIRQQHAGTQHQQRCSLPSHPKDRPPRYQTWPERAVAIYDELQRLGFTEASRALKNDIRKRFALETQSNKDPRGESDTVLYVSSESDSDESDSDTDDKRSTSDSVLALLLLSRRL